MQKILEQQRDRIAERLKETEEPKAIQLSLFPVEEQQQLEADKRYWTKRLKTLAEEIVTEPARIEATYQIKAVRVDPVGLMYLYPVSG
jgi:hypothetical protein